MPFAVAQVARWLFSVPDGVPVFSAEGLREAEAAAKTADRPSILRSVHSRLVSISIRFLACAEGIQTPSSLL
ncbi:hypothetical protein BW737_001770 [Actinomyces ruminis]|uniref:Uncharacterized protein n=1 Tax=Actinomyces ruminis TaxID=1937003 RepID=A0ABX4MHF9_9ACTO|nr:hypothetical protein BW737_001770 [Actinomyces ruminis]